MDHESHAKEGLPPDVPETMVSGVTQQLVVPLAVHGTDELGAAALLSVLRRDGVDLRRRMFVAYFIDFAAQREDADAAALSVRNTEWDHALYGDVTGWVLRLSRTRRLTREAVLADVTEVRRLAAAHRGVVRGVTIEDLRQDDVWSGMASRLESGSRRREDETAAAPAIPVPRQHVSARADR
jgi:hypothetical protein